MGISSILMSTKGEHTFVMYVLNFWNTRNSSPIKWRGWPVLTILCYLHCRKDKLWFIMPGCFKVSVSWLAGQRTEKCAYGWLPWIYWLHAVCVFVFGWVAHWLDDQRYGHVPVIEFRIVQTRIYIVCFQIVLFVFGAHSTRAAECVIGFAWSNY